MFTVANEPKNYRTTLGNLKEANRSLKRAIRKELSYKKKLLKYHNENKQLHKDLIQLKNEREVGLSDRLY